MQKKQIMSPLVWMVMLLTVAWFMAGMYIVSSIPWNGASDDTLLKSASFEPTGHARNI